MPVGSGLPTGAEISGATATCAEITLFGCAVCTALRKL